MALDLGTLRGFLDLDESRFDGVLDKLPDKLKGSGVLMAAAGAVVAVGIGTAITDGIANAVEMEDANAKITANLGLTAEESARIGQLAGSLYADAYGESVQDVSGAIENVVSSIDGMRQASGEAVEDTTAKLLNLQSAMGIDTARSAQLVGQLIKNGLATDANGAIDLLVGNLQRVPAALREDLLDAVDEYGPILANMGYSGEEAFGMLAAAADKGMYGIDKTGDALKELSIRATDMSTASRDAYTAAGLNAEEMAAKFTAGGESARGATQELINALLGMGDPVAQSNAAIALFGTPLEDLGTQEIPRFLDNLGQVQDGFKSTAGAAEAMDETLGGTASAGWTSLQRTWDGIIAQVGTALLPILTSVLDYLNENPAVLQAVAIAVGVLAAAFVGLSIATWAMNTALLASPITWIILAIVALVGAVIWLAMNWDQVVAWITEVWGGFIGWITGVVEGLLGWWDGVWQGFLGFLSDAWNNILAFLGAALQWVVDLFLNWTLLGIIIQHWDAIVQGTTTAWNNVLAFIGGVPGAIIGFFAGVGQWLLNAGRNLIGGMLSGITNGWNGLMGFLGSIPGTIMGFFGGIGNWLWSAGRDLINGLLGGIRSLAGTIGNFFLGLLPDWIVGPFKAALGIASPSKVFREYGRNIVQGLVLGAGDEQANIEATMAGLVNVPPTSSQSAAMSAAQQAADAAAAARAGAAGTSARPIIVEGNVGYSPEEIARELDERDRQAQALAGIDELVGVA